MYDLPSCRAFAGDRYRAHICPFERKNNKHSVPAGYAHFLEPDFKWNEYSADITSHNE